MRNTIARTAALMALSLAAACGGGDGATRRVVVPRGASVSEATDSLVAAGVVRARHLFRVYAWLRGGERSIKAGTYLFHQGDGWGTVVEKLRSGRGIMHTVTIPEGFSISQITPLLVDRLGVSADSVNAAVRDSALLARLGLTTATIEGYLFPTTYTFADGTSAREAITTMERQFEAEWQPAWTARLDSIGLSRNQVMTLASIVEKEAKLPEERPAIAAVYMNRLHAHMLLQADPTVQYALGQHRARVYFKDLRVQSPYNTYRYRGLPPGPIASPGVASIVAALYPARVPYRYFVASPDGHHEFRVSLSAHEQAVREARRARSKSASGAASRDTSTTTSRSAPRARP
jgi:UPF0755 protein